MKIPGVPELTEKVEGLFDLLNDGDDLACVLIATSYLDQTLASILERFLIKGDTSSRLLSPVGGALGSFATRTDMAYCLGLISKGLYQNLRAVGEIRNEFAHHYLALSFADQRVAVLTGKLSSPSIDQSILIDADGSVSHGAASPWASDASPRDRFSVVVVHMAMRLLLLGHSIERCERPTKHW